MIHPYDPQAAMNAKYAAFARKDAATARRLQADPAGRAIEEAQQRIAAKRAEQADRERIRAIIAEATRKAVPMHTGGWVTANNVLAALDWEGYTVAPRASQAATATNGPGDDHGAGAGPDKPAAANSGARMRPEDVPEELVTMMADAELDAPPGCSAADSYRTVLAAVIPAIRAAIADEIERLYNPNDPADDDHDEAIRDVIRHLRGLCTICGQAPDAEPCGHAHAINLRGDQ